MAPLAFLERLAALAREHGFVLASDEAYTELWFEEPPPSALQLADLRNVAVFNTLSKRSSMTGFRSGFVAGDAELIAALRQYRPNIGTAPQEFVQRASVVAWGDEAHVVRARERTRASGSVLLDVLGRKGLRNAGGARDDVPLDRGPGGETSEAHAARLLEHGVIVTPGAYPRAVGRGLRALRARTHRGRVRPRGRDPGGCPLMDARARRSRRCGTSGELEAAPIEEAIDLLDRGELRVAEPGADGWVVNEWAKKAILLYFRLRKVEPIEVGGLRVPRQDPA